MLMPQTEGDREGWLVKRLEELCWRLNGKWRAVWTAGWNGEHENCVVKRERKKYVLTKRQGRKWRQKIWQVIICEIQMGFSNVLGMAGERHGCRDAGMLGPDVGWWYSHVQSPGTHANDGPTRTPPSAYAHTHKRTYTCAHGWKGRLGIRNSHFSLLVYRIISLWCWYLL